ncbi:MAG: hypothetical protein HYU51_03540 [Candidatus Rokubacteria bacterium]|nr:hypothetical protein [Candidatus Rokubacteria bacterium]
MLVLSLALVVPAWAHADDSLVRFDGGIGVHPVAGVSGVGVIDANGNNVFPDVVRNDFVRGGVRVPPGGRPWVIARLRADVETDGRISVDGRGLLLAGGNNLGRNGGQSVRAVLFCGNDRFQTDPPVALEANGDFRIDDVLMPVAPTVLAFPPDPCENAVLLIVSAGGNWFAAGIEKLED